MDITIGTFVEIITLFITFITLLYVVHSKYQKDKDKKRELCKELRAWRSNSGAFDINSDSEKMRLFGNGIYDERHAAPRKVKKAIEAYYNTKDIKGQRLAQNDLYHIIDNQCK